MSTRRKFDIIVFGATGFTGERICLCLSRYIVKSKLTLSVAISGRSESKLLQLQQRIVRHSPSLKPMSLVVADVEDAASMLNMASQTQVVIAAAGPYRFFGEAVVKACVSARTHYCDVTGEPEFIERMMVKYSDEARSAAVSVVTSCGFDSIPADLGALYTTQQFYERHKASPDGSSNAPSKKEAEEVDAETDQLLSSSSTSTSTSTISTNSNLVRICEIDSFFHILIGAYGFVGNTGTWYSLVHGLGSTSALSAIRKALRARFQKENVVVPRVGQPSAHSAIFREQRLKNLAGLPTVYYTMRFPGADASVVRNSQLLLTELQQNEQRAAPRPVSINDTSASSSSSSALSRPSLPYYNAYFTVRSIWTVLSLLVFALTLAFFTKFSWGRALLLKYPRLFSFGMFNPAGPSQEQIDNCSFTMDFLASGYCLPPAQLADTKQIDKIKPNRFLHTRVRGPEVGYVTTCICAVQSALQLLKHSAPTDTTIPRGVVTTAAAFANTNLIQVLNDEGVVFETLP